MKAHRSDHLPRLILYQDDASLNLRMEGQRLIAHSDHFHLPPLPDAEARRYKEWLHFCVLDPSVQAILNFNLSGDTPSARVIILTHDAGWDGDVDSISSGNVEVHSSLIDARFGQDTLRFKDGVFVLSAALQDRPIALTLKLRPLVMPTLMHNSMPIPHGDMNWLVVPRLTASGTITIGERVHALNDVPAYHDHNWGHWLWGQDFAWQWGFALSGSAPRISPRPWPESPWSVVFCRTTNRARNRVFDLTLGLWKNDGLRRVFTRREIQVSQAGYLRRKRVDKYPRVMALVSPESTTDVPRHLELVAASEGDKVHGHFYAQDVAQVVIPNETDLDSTIVNEVVGRFEMEGQVAGEAVSMEGSGIFEFLMA